MDRLTGYDYLRARAEDTMVRGAFSFVLPASVTRATSPTTMNPWSAS